MSQQVKKMTLKEGGKKTQFFSFFILFIYSEKPEILREILTAPQEYEEGILEWKLYVHGHTGMCGSGWQFAGPLGGYRLS